MCVCKLCGQRDAGQQLVFMGTFGVCGGLCRVPLLGYRKDVNPGFKYQFGGTLDRFSARKRKISDNECVIPRSMSWCTLTC